MIRQSFSIAFGEAFEAFIIVAVLFSYLKRSGHARLLPAVYWGAGLSVFASAGLGYLMREGVGKSLLESFLGFLAAGFLSLFLIHAAQAASKAKNTAGQAEILPEDHKVVCFWVILAFTVLMIVREGFEVAVLMIQIQDLLAATAIISGVLAAAFFCCGLAYFSCFAQPKYFFQAAVLFLSLSLIVVAVHAFHELTETGILPGSEMLHEATEPFAADGYYGKWFFPLIAFVCTIWLAGVQFSGKFRRGRIS